MKNNSWGQKTRELWNSVVEYSKKRVGTIALFLCLLVTGIAVALVFVSSPNDDTKSASDSQDERLEDAVLRTLEPLPTVTVNTDALATPTPTPTPKPTVPEDFTQAPTESKQPGTKTLLNPPVQGAVIWDYAMDELIYSETLDQWMTHGGVDIACDKGTQVRSVNAGIVERVYIDDELGTTVIIEHENGHKSIYSGLLEGSTPDEGAKVAANAVIGECGNTATSECALASHIHFEYHIDNRPVNPQDYVLFTS